MANPNRTSLPAGPAPCPAAVASWASLFLQPFLDAQRLQWLAYLDGQQWLTTLQRDLWEQWAVRYGGGVPIDV